MFDLHLAHFKPIVHTRRSVASASAVGTLNDDRSPNDDENEADSESGMSRGIRRRRHTGPFHLEQLPYFTGDFIYTELEVVLAQLEQVDSDLTETKMREWWLRIWGPNAAVEVVREEGARDDGLLFDEFGLPCPGTLIYVKPTIPQPPMETLMRLERECCSVSDRDEWIMRKVSGAVRPQKDNFFVLVFSKNALRSQVIPKSSSELNEPPSQGSKRAKVSDEPENVSRTFPPPSLVADLSDPDPLLPRTCFDSRLCFLDLCIVNHLQFSSFRHAKFSTAVVLQYLKRSFENRAM
jgi:hypothetical protein